MKKIIALLLVVLMCLSLVGCNAGTAKYAKYMGIINALEKKDYEGAMEEIYQMYLEDGGEDNTSDADVSSKPGDTSSEDETSSVVEAEITPEVEMWLERAPGEYMGYNYDEEAPENFVLNADKTCTIWGGDYTWDFQKNWDGSEYYCYDTYTYVYVFDGETKVYEISLNLQEEDYITAYLYTVDEEGYTDSTDGYFFNMADLQVIELTIDNWQDYFEYVEDGEVTYDSFGDPDGAQIDTYYLLKEEYGYVLTNLSSVAIEYVEQNVRQMITIDVEELTYEWGEVTYTYDPSDPYVTEMYSQYLSDETYRYGTNVSYTYIDEFPEDEVYQDINFEMTRLQGTIYCVPAK